MKNYTKIIAAVAAGLTCAAATSQASLITSLTVGAPPASIVADGDSTATTGAPTVSYPYNFTGVDGTEIGTLTSWVLTSDTYGVASGFTGLVFAYQFSSTGADPLAGFAINGYTGPVGVALASGSIASAVASYNSGGTVNVNLGTLNGTSPLVYVYTDATSYGGSTGYIYDGSPSANGPTLAPVPEPTTVVAGALMLLPFGFGAIRSLRKDRIA